MRKKLIPVLTVLGLIVLVIIAGVTTMVVKRYLPSNQMMDSAEYFGLPGEDETAVVVNGAVIEGKGKLIDGRAYLDDKTVSGYVNSRFYWDSNEKRMIYTLPEEMIEFQIDSREYQTTDGVKNEDYEITKLIDDKVYLALDFIEKYTDMQYQAYEAPQRIVLWTPDSNRQQAVVEKSGNVRKKGGIKSPVLKKADQEEKVFVVEDLDNWSKVSTSDGYTGYIQKKNLSTPEAVPWEGKEESVAYSSIKKDYKINLAWHQVTSAKANESLTNMTRAAKGLNTISPTWFSIVDGDGKISSLASKEYVKQAHEAGLEVWGLIDNFSPDIKTYDVLSWTKKRTYIIKQLIKVAKKVGLDGINVDFESITEETGPHFVQFIRELSIRCRKEQLVLSVDNPVPQPYNKHYNRKEQGIVADYVIIMGYDEHYNGGSEVGSVASRGFVRDGIEQTLKEVPKDKVINGIPFYTRVWSEPYGSSNISSEVLGMDGTDKYIKEHQMDTYWDQGAGQNVAELDADDALYRIWVEDEKSIEEKMRLIKEHQLAGVAEWKLGFERDSIWSVIDQYLK